MEFGVRCCFSRASSGKEAGLARGGRLAGGVAGFCSSSALASSSLMLERLRRRNFIGVSRVLG
ncbi:hypothetical protein D3C87_1331010 [compost metagenome]